MTEQAQSGPAPDRNLALELVRATEAAAIGGARHLGRGDRSRSTRRPSTHAPGLGQIAMDGVVVIGEGEKDNAPCSTTASGSAAAARPRSTSPSTRSHGTT